MNKCIRIDQGTKIAHVQTSVISEILQGSNTADQLNCIVVMGVGHDDSM